MVNAGDDDTSDEDVQGLTKAKRGDGWLGLGEPPTVGRGPRSCELTDGGGFCYPGRWQPHRRWLPPKGKVIEDMV